VQNPTEQPPRGAHRVTQMPAVAICKKHMLIWQVVLLFNSIEEILYNVSLKKEE